MELSGNYMFDAPRELTWTALQDPKVLGSVMPGGQGFDQVAENQFAGVLHVKIGPVQGAFQATIKLSDVQPPESYRIEVDGKGAPGFVKAIGSLRLEARDSQTYMEYTGQGQIGGRIASVGQRLLDASARSIIRQGLDGLNEYLKVQVAQQAQQQAAAAAATEAESAAATAARVAMPAPAVAPLPPLPSVAPAISYKPPSQTQLAINVARDVFNDMVPARYRPLVVAATVGVIVSLIWLVSRLVCNRKYSNRDRGS